MKKHTLIPAAYLILRKEDKVLLLKRKNTGYEDGNFNLIAGHVKRGEPFTDTVIREAYEEGGINIYKKDITPYFITHHKAKDKSERINIFFTCSKWKGTIKNMEPEKCDKLQWFSTKSLPKNTTPFIKEILKKELNHFFIEYGWE